MKPRRALALVLHPHAERTREVPRRLGNRLGSFAFQDAVLGCVPHPERAAPGMGGGHDLEVGDRNEVADLQLALARDRKRRRLHPPDPDHALRATAERDRRGAGQRQVVDLVGLTARDGGGVERGMLGVGPGAAEGVANGLRILRGEHHPHHLAAVAAILQDLLADELSLPVAVGREPDPLRRAQGGPDRLQLRGLVAASGRLGAVKPLGLQQLRRPAFPGRVRVLRLAQVEQMALRGEDGAVAGPDGGADILRLAGLLGDDDLVGHDVERRGRLTPYRG